VYPVPRIYGRQGQVHVHVHGLYPHGDEDAAGVAGDAGHRVAGVVHQPGGQQEDRPDHL